MYCTNTLRIVIISIAMVLAFVAAVNPRRARAPPTILGCSCLSTSFSRSSAYSARTFITPTPVPNQTRLSAFLLLAQNSFPNLNVHTGVPPTEEARRRENVSECRKLVVGLGTDGPRVDSGLFELAGTVDGYPLSYPSIYRGSARQRSDPGPLALPCPGVTGHVFAIALPADQLTLNVPSVFLSRPWVKQPTVHPTRCKLLSRHASMYLRTPASTEKHASRGRRSHC